MSKVVIKRDGSRELYNPDKIVRWASWAAIEPEMARIWPRVVAQALLNTPDEVTSREIQDSLIREFLDLNTDTAYIVAGRLYASHMRKEIFGTDEPPLLIDVHTKLIRDGIMRDMGYTPAEYVKIEAMLDHARDFQARHYQLEQIRFKYALRNRISGKEYESRQMVYARLAMAVYENYKGEDRLDKVHAMYEELSQERLSLPTPNYVNFGTLLRNYSSCCLIAAGDSAESLAVANHIAYSMTVASAGIGIAMNIRSINDSVRGGLIRHMGVLPYMAMFGKTIKSNTQNGRGGAGNIFHTIMNPEADKIMRLRDVRSVNELRNRDLHYAMIDNHYFAKQLANDEETFVWNIHTAPELHKAMFSKDPSDYEREYKRLLNDPLFPKRFVRTRDLFMDLLVARTGTGTYYKMCATNVNAHTPLLEPIHSSNLCMEVVEITKPYERMEDLFTEEDHGRGEIAMCNIAAINIAAIGDYDDVQYAKTARAALEVIDFTIDESTYVFPHLGMTTKARRYAGVGIMNFAYSMARNQFKYDSDEGRQYAHETAERHMYWLIRASLGIAKERGVAPWIHKTLWPKGWTPLMTYNRNVDKIQDFELRYQDWDELSKEIIETGGIAHSLLVCYMPGEASSKAVGACNSIYPVREKLMLKTDNHITVRWSAPEGDNPFVEYDSAWEVPAKAMYQIYAIFQKFTDQAISADSYRVLGPGETVSAMEALELHLYAKSIGIKTDYYDNTNTSSGVDINVVRDLSAEANADDCENCKM